MCGEPGSARYRPFCSRRCADHDLGLWFSETYTAPVVDQEEFSELPQKPANDDD